MAAGSGGGNAIIAESAVVATATGAGATDDVAFGPTLGGDLVHGRMGEDGFREFVLRNSVGTVSPPLKI